MRARPLEVAPFEREGRRCVRLRDPLGLSPNASAEGGWVVSAQRWDELRAGDDEATRQLLLDDGACAAALRVARERWDASEALAARGAGLDYEADAFALRVAVAGMVADDWDMPPPADASALWLPATGLRGRSALFARGWAAVRHLAPGF
ncbi:MAG TPA: hypothetical protein VMT18_15350, partial [Planctomycetota bacterium]|nr:hypothetical protein [Planctomycetota bacterium]